MIYINKRYECKTNKYRTAFHVAVLLFINQYFINACLADDHPNNMPTSPQEDNNTNARPGHLEPTAMTFSDYPVFLIQFAERIATSPSNSYLIVIKHNHNDKMEGKCTAQLYMNPISSMIDRCDGRKVMNAAPSKTLELDAELAIMIHNIWVDSLYNVHYSRNTQVLMLDGVKYYFAAYTGSKDNDDGVRLLRGETVNIDETIGNDQVVIIVRIGMLIKKMFDQDKNDNEGTIKIKQRIIDLAKSLPPIQYQFQPCRVQDGAVNKGKSRVREGASERGHLNPTPGGDHITEQQ